MLAIYGTVHVLLIPAFNVLHFYIRTLLLLLLLLLLLPVANEKEPL